MNSNTSSPSPPVSSGLQEPTLPEAPEVKMEIDDPSYTPEMVGGPSTSAAAMARPSISPGTAPGPAPSPTAASSSDEATANSDAEAEAAPRAVATTTGGGHTGVMDMATFFQLQQNQVALQQLINAGADGGNPSLALVKLFNAFHQTTNPNSPGGEGGKKSRLKVFSNGYFMTFDKISSCRKKHFWRCEYKNTCKARMHTDIESEKIVTYIHDHNHSPPTPEEIELYGIDPAEIERNRVYIVGNVSDSNLRRKIRKQVADREAAARRLEQQQREELQKKQNEATMAAAHEAYARAVSSGALLNAQSGASQMAAAATLFHSAAAAAVATSSVTGGAGAATASSSSLPSTAPAAPINPHALLMAQLPSFTNMVKNETASVYVPSYMSSPNMPIATTSGVPPLVIPKPEPIKSASQPSFKRRAVETNEDTEIMSHPNFEPTFQIARQLRKLWKGAPGRYPRTSQHPSTYFEFYVAKYDGADEHLYVPARIEHRDEAHMRDALQQFSGEQCIGMLLFKVSPKISVVFNKPMLSVWDNNQFFLLDTSNPSSWRLMYVDDQAV